jgi:hypothetical protein
MMKVKPTNPGAVIRDPLTRRPLPAEGADVPESNFWLRRLADGDVTKVDEAKPARAAAPLDNAVAPLTTRDAKKG